MFSDHLDEVPGITGLKKEHQRIPLYSLHQGGVVQGDGFKAHIFTSRRVLMWNQIPIKGYLTQISQFYFIKISYFRIKKFNYYEHFI